MNRAPRLRLELCLLVFMAGWGASSTGTTGCPASGDGHCACTGVWCAASGRGAGPPAPGVFVGNATTAVSVVSTRNFAVKNAVFGGWGPALRRVMPDPTATPRAASSGTASTRAGP